jgi:hypothetical protein
LKISRLKSATFREVFRIEIEYYPFPFEVCKAGLFAFIGCQIECGSIGSDYWHLSACCSRSQDKDSDREEHETE